MGPEYTMALPRKTLKISDEITYSYYVTPALSNNPTLLFLHGFPSAASDWSLQATYFSSQGYGVIVPDLLGYGATSKPEAVSAYNWRSMSGHIAGILDAEGIPQVFGVGHDLGSWFLSRLYHFHPARFLGLAFLGVGYIAPGDKFDVEMINQMTKQMTGEERFRYWDVFTSDDGVALMDQHVPAVITLMHAEPAIMAQNLGPPGKAKAWIAQDKTAPMHFGDSQSKYFKDRVQMFTEGGFTGPTNWYRALRSNISFQDEETMEKEIRVPTLLIESGEDEMTPAGFQDQLTRQWARAPYRFEELKTGHWVMMEDAEGTNRIIHEFVKHC